MKCDKLENKDYNNGMTAYELMEANGLIDAAKTVKDAIAELKEKLEDAQREVNNYRRHANECEGLAAKGDIDKVSLLEEIKELKNDKELLDSQLYGFLQLEEECGGGDLRNYIAELKDKIKYKESVGQRWFERCMEARTENVRLKRALWLARAEWARSAALSHHLIESHPNKDVAATYKRKANKWEKVKDKCLNKAEEYK